MLIAQLTDLHLTRRGELAQHEVDTRARLDAVIDSLKASASRPDVVLVTGDIADDGHPDAYQALHERLGELAIAYLLIPGNHDHRQRLASRFPGHPGMHGNDFIQYAVEDFPVRLVGLDTTIAGSDRGLLCAERLDWLDRCLAGQAGRPTLLFMHHPPFATGIDEMDGYGLDGAEAFAAVVRRHRQVVRIVCGHVHRPIQTLFAGVPTSIAPSTAFMQALGLGANGDKGFLVDAPKYELHLWTGAAFVSHLVTLEAQRGPIPYPYP